AYTLTFTLDNESRGISSPESNRNSLVIAALDEASSDAGAFSGYAAEDYDATGAATLAYSGLKAGVTSWSFKWTAPSAGAGRVPLSGAVVDGNGANSPPGVVLQDPYGDDVAVGEIALSETSASAVLGIPRTPTRRFFQGVRRPESPEALRTSPRPAPLPAPLV